MRPDKLIGQKAIRTKPVMVNGHLDHSHITTPILIKAVTASHIVYESNTILGGTKDNLLDYRWVDDNWESYDYLIYLASEQYQEDLKKLTEIPNKEDDINEI